MNDQELREYYRTLMVCHSELCWLFEKDIAEPQVRRLIKIFREEMQRVEDELDQLEIGEAVLNTQKVTRSNN